MPTTFRRNPIVQIDASKTQRVQEQRVQEQRVQRQRVQKNFLPNNWLSHSLTAFTIFTLTALPGNAKEFRIDSQKVFDELRDANFQPGDSIRFQRGQRFQGMFAPSGSGTEQSPITISAYGSGAPPRIDAGGESIAAVQLRNVSFWEVDGLEVTNTNGTDDDQGTLFGIHVSIKRKEGTFRHLYINDCHVHNVNGLVAGKRRGGIHVHIERCKRSRIDDLRITNNRVERIGGVGIGNDSSCGAVKIMSDSETTEHLWTNVYVAGNFVDQTGRNSVIARVSKGAIYEFNTLANSSRFDTGHSIFCFNTDGIKIQHNEAYGNVGKEGMDRGGFDADYNCINTFIQYNYSHDNMWFCGIMKKPNRNVVIRYNISQNEKKGLYFYGFNREKDAENIHIYNNTHFVRDGLKVKVFPENRTPINTRFENNIFYFERKGSWGKHANGINTKFENNLYFNIKPHASDKAAIAGDPRFVQAGQAGTRINLLTKKSLLGYRLQPGSSAIDRGLPIKISASTEDFFGHRIKNDVRNIGAVEGK